MTRYAFTGGSGLLGSELKRHFEGALYPGHAELDVADRQKVESFFIKNSFDEIVHLAAFISPPKIDKDPYRAIDVNIIGTAYLAEACVKHGKKLIYISTDYVFDGKKGNYREEDPVYPVNKYAWSKLGGECSVRLCDNHLIIRTSFGPNKFPYPKAFSDQWTSREPVSVVAQKIAVLIKRNAHGTYHVGGNRKTVHEYALSQTNSGTIEAIERKDADFPIPADTSLNSEKYEKLTRSHKK